MSLWSISVTTRNAVSWYIFSSYDGAWPEQMSSARPCCDVIMSLLTTCPILIQFQVIWCIRARGLGWWEGRQYEDVTTRYLTCQSDALSSSDMAMTSPDKTFMNSYREWTNHTALFYRRGHILFRRCINIPCYWILGRSDFLILNSWFWNGFQWAQN